jgi:hypothetical protein
VTITSSIVWSAKVAVEIKAGTSSPKVLLNSVALWLDLYIKSLSNSKLRRPGDKDEVKAKK